MIILPAILSTACILLLTRAWSEADEFSEREMNATRVTAMAEVFAFHRILNQGHVLYKAAAERRLRADLAKLTVDEKKHVQKVRAAIRDAVRHGIPEEGVTADIPLERRIAFGAEFGLKADRLIFYQELISDFIDVESLERQNELANVLEAEGYEHLREMAASQPSALQFVERIMASSGRYKELAEDASQPSHSKVPDILPAIAVLRELFDVATLSQDYLDAENADIANMRAKQAHNKAQLFDGVYLGFAASLLLAAVLLVSYGQYLKHRLQVLLEYARAMAAQSARPNQLKGDDEFVAVQDALVNVDRRLSELAEFRSFVAGMVAHDVRTPLMSAHLNMTMAKSGLPNDDAARIAAAQSEVESTIEFVEKLLSVEQQASLNKPDERPAPSSSSASLWSSGLFKKVLLIVCLPLLLQGAWLVWVSNQWTVKENLNNDQRKVADQVLRSECIFNLASITADGAVLWAFSGKRKYHEASAKARARFNVLRDATAHEGSSSLQKGLAEELAPVLQEILLFDLPEPNLTRLPAVDGIHGVLEQTKDILLKSVPLLRAQVDENLRLEAKFLAFAKKAQRIIVMGLLANLCIYGLLGIYFSYSIRRRLNLLVLNAYSLMDQKASGLPVGGSDELEQLAQILESARARLKQATQLRTELMREIADGIRQPLVKVQESIRATEAKDAESRDVLADAAESVDQVVELVNTLLIADQIEAGSLALEVVPCPLSDVINRAVDVVSPLAKQKNVRIDCDATPDMVEVDKARMVQVVVNVLDNAIKFSPTGGVIKVAACNDEFAIKLSVQDQGQGMDPETAAHVFGKFFQARETGRSGFGLGLYVCKRIVEMHGGTIHVESELGAGSKFIIELPLHAESRAPLSVSR